MTKLQPGTPIGPFIIESALPKAEGGMATVYMAITDRDGTIYRVALKLANTKANIKRQDAEMLQHFYFEALSNEVEVLRKLHHPGIIRILPIPSKLRRNPYIARATGLPAEPWYYTMEYLAGGTLESIIRKERRLPVNLAVEIVAQVCQALEYAHKNDVFHLDVKPNNIMFRRPWNREEVPEVVLVDWGIARAKGKAAKDAGNIYYMSPERLREDDAAGTEIVIDAGPSDIYSLGVCLYRALTGHLPFEGRTRSGVTTAILNDTPTSPSQHMRAGAIRPDFEALILQMLHKNPKERPTPIELAETLDVVVPPPRVTGEYEIKDPPPETRTDNGKWRLLTAGLLAVALLEGGLLAKPLVFPSEPTPTPPPAIETMETPVEKEVLPITMTPISPTPSAVLTDIPTVTPSGTMTPTALAPTSTRTPSPTRTRTKTPTAALTSTPIPESMVTVIPTFTPMPVPTATSTDTPELSTDTSEPPPLPTRPPDTPEPTTPPWPSPSRPAPPPPPSSTPVPPTDTDTPVPPPTRLRFER